MSSVQVGRVPGKGQGSVSILLRGWLEAVHTGCGAGAPQAGTRDSSLLTPCGDSWASCWLSHQGGCTEGSDYSSQTKTPTPAQAGWAGKGGSLGREGTMGGVLKALSHPVVKAPAISLPCHRPSHSKAPGASPLATQGVRAFSKPHPCLGLVGGHEGGKMI